MRTFMRSVHQSAWSAGGQTSRVPFKAHIRRGDAAPFPLMLQAWGTPVRWDIRTWDPPSQ